VMMDTVYFTVEGAGLSIRDAHVCKRETDVTINRQELFVVVVKTSEGTFFTRGCCCCCCCSCWAPEPVKSFGPIDRDSDKRGEG
jgi:hypothetical protein